MCLGRTFQTFTLLPNLSGKLLPILLPILLCALFFAYQKTSLAHTHTSDGKKKSRIRAQGKLTLGTPCCACLSLYMAEINRNATHRGYWCCLGWGVPGIHIIVFAGRACFLPRKRTEKSRSCWRVKEGIIFSIAKNNERATSPGWCHLPSTRSLLCWPLPSFVSRPLSVVGFTFKITLASVNTDVWRPCFLVARSGQNANHSER